MIPAGQVTHVSYMLLCETSGTYRHTHTQTSPCHEELSLKQTLLLA